MRSLAIHPLRPEHVFLGTADGQIFFSLDTGSHWIRLEPGLGRRDVVIDNFAFHPTDPDLIYAASWELRRNHGLLARTTDGGATWETLPTGHINSQIRAIAIAPTQPNFIALGVSEGVLLSRDAGQTWRNIALGYSGLQNVESLAFDPLDAQTLYAGTWRLGWKTTNLGQRWTEIHEGMHFDSDMFSIVVNPLQTEVLYSSACTGIYKSVNGGLRWRKLKSGIPKDAHRTRMLQLDPSRPDTIYAGTTRGLFVSLDAGGHWENLIPDLVVNAISVSPRDSRVILVGTDDAGVLKSVDGGQNFKSSNAGFIHRQVAALAVMPDNPLVVIAGLVQDGTHGGFFISEDGGVTWTQHNQGLGSAASITRILTVPGSNQIYLATQKGVYHANPLVEDWKQIASTAELAVNDLVLGLNPRELALAARQGLYHVDRETGDLRPWSGAPEGAAYGLLAEPARRHLFAATGRGLYRFTSSGGWLSIQGGLPEGAINFLKRNQDRLLAGTRQGIYISDDEGASWSRPQSIFPLNIVDLSINPGDPRHLVATDSTGGYLFESWDAGDSWKPFPPENRSRITRLSFTRDGTILAATLSEGVYLLHMPVRRAGD